MSSNLPRKLSAFRQLSLHCDTEFSLKSKTRDRPPHPIKIAWAAEDDPSEEGVVAKRCGKEQKRTAKLTRHSSLEKDSILYSKHDLIENIVNKDNNKVAEKANLSIFLVHNTTATHEQDYEDDLFSEVEVITKCQPPKLMQPLLDTKNIFQMRKSKDSNTNKPNAIVVVPSIVTTSPPVSSRSTGSAKNSAAESKAIKNVIIRPATAAAKRERFQKRANSAFNSVVKEVSPQPTRRPPLIRSSSAPTAKPAADKPIKFFASKRKIIKSANRRKSGNQHDFKASSEDDGSNKENPKNKKEMNRYVHGQGSEVVTMVSLVSPAASDNEDVEIMEKPKSPTKTIAKKESSEPPPKNLSLRKTVKSVSFQQSSIYAIRSFSASFPGRRASMATALNPKQAAKCQQEKRSTNCGASDEDERLAKRRLVRSATEQSRKSNNDSKATEEEESQEQAGSNIEVKITPKDAEVELLVQSTEQNETAEKCATDENSIQAEATKESEENKRFGSDKERQCWNMYCKMADKGLRVSYDTILRGMLTPTEYRMRRKESLEHESGEEAVGSTSGK